MSLVLLPDVFRRLLKNKKKEDGSSSVQSDRMCCRSRICISSSSYWQVAKCCSRAEIWKRRERESSSSERNPQEGESKVRERREGATQRKADGKKKLPFHSTGAVDFKSAMELTSSPRTRVGKYELGNTLGEGTFAKVKIAKNKETGESVAIKVIDKEKILKHKMVDQVARPTWLSLSLLFWKRIPSWYALDSKRPRSGVFIGSGVFFLAVDLGQIRL